MLRSRENCYFSFCKLPSFEQYREFCQPGCPWAGPLSPLRSPGCFCQHDPWLLALLLRVAPPSSSPSLGPALFSCESHSFPFITLLSGFKFFTVSIPNTGCMSSCCPKCGPNSSCPESGMFPKDSVRPWAYVGRAKVPTKAQGFRALVQILGKPRQRRSRRWFLPKV